MHTISANVTKKELDAIREYANVCGETMSNLIRKTMIKEAIFQNCFGGSLEYPCSIPFSENLIGEEEDELLKNSINKIRKILGVETISEL